MLRTESNFAQLLIAGAIPTAAVDLMSVTQNAETGQRGCLPTREAYLNPYAQAVTHHAQSFAVLSGAVAASPDLRPAMEQLSTLEPH